MSVRASDLPGLCLLLGVVLQAGCAGAPPEKPAGGEPLVVTDMAGVSHDLDAALARGETVALVFWQTWCGSCAREAPRLVEAVKEHGPKILFLGVVPGKPETVDEAEVRRVARRWGYEAFPQVRDRDLGLSQRLQVEGTPTIVVLGKERRVLYHAHRPPQDWASFHGAPRT